jgi:hypothetical protein
VSYGPTLDELTRRTRGMLSEKDSDYFDDESVRDYLNEAHDVIADEAAWVFVSAWRGKLAINSPHWSLPTACLVPTGVEIRDTSGVVFRTDYIEEDALDAWRGRGSQGSGTPWRVTYGIAADGPYLSVWPPPSSAFELYVEGYKRPTPMVDPTDRSDLPPQFAHAPIQYALWKCKVADEESAQQDRGGRDFQLWLQSVQIRRMQSDADQNNVVRYRRGMSNLPWPWFD